MKHVAVADTDIGKVRAVNQDAYLVDDHQDLFIVADGMGGHAGGEIASKLCVTEVSHFLQKEKLDYDPSSPENENQVVRISEALSRAINSASTIIYERALENPSLKGMGTTATLFKIINNYAFYAHVGDSRLYLFRTGFLYQLTNDHSLVSEQVRAGIITEEEAELHQLRNVITRSVGYQEQEDVDTDFIKLEKGDLYLLCSDGLYGKVSDREIAGILKDKQENSVKDLIKLANDRGGDDNITGLIVKIT